MSGVVRLKRQRHAGSRDSLRLAPLRQPAAQSIPIELCMVGIDRPLAQLLVGLDDTLHDLRQVIYTQVSAHKLPPRFAFTNVDGTVVLARLEPTKLAADFAPRVSVVPKTVRGGLPASGRIAAIRKARAAVAAALDDSGDTKMASTINPPMRTAWEPIPSDRLRKKSLLTWLKGSPRRSSPTRRASHYTSRLAISSSLGAAALGEGSRIEAAVVQELCHILNEYASKAAVELQRLQRGRIGRRLAAQRNKDYRIERHRLNLTKTRQATRRSMACRLKGKRIRLDSNIKSQSVPKQSQEKNASSARADSRCSTQIESHERPKAAHTAVQQEVRGLARAGLASCEDKDADRNIGHVAMNHSLTLKPAGAEVLMNVTRELSKSNESSQYETLPSKYEQPSPDTHYTGQDKLSFEQMSQFQHPGHNLRSNVTSPAMTVQFAPAPGDSQDNLMAIRSSAPNGQESFTNMNLPETASQTVAHTTSTTELARWQAQLPCRADGPLHVDMPLKRVTAVVSSNPMSCVHLKKADIPVNCSPASEQGSCVNVSLLHAPGDSAPATKHNLDPYPEPDVECDPPANRVRRGSDVPTIDVVRRAGKRLLVRGVVISGFKTLCMIFLSSITSAGFEVEVLLMDHNSKLLTAEISQHDLSRIREGFQVPLEAKDEVLAETVLRTIEIQRATPSSSYELVVNLPPLERHGSANSIDSGYISDGITPSKSAEDENSVGLGYLCKPAPNDCAYEFGALHDYNTLRKGFAQQLTIQNRPHIGCLFASEHFSSFKLNVYDTSCDEMANISLSRKDLVPTCEGGAVNIRILGHAVFAALSSMNEIDLSRTDKLREALVHIIAFRDATSIVRDQLPNDADNSSSIESGKEGFSSLSTRKDPANAGGNNFSAKKSHAEKNVPRVTHDEPRIKGGWAVTIQHSRCLMSLIWSERTDSINIQLHRPSDDAVAEVRLTKKDLDSLELAMEDMEQVGTIFANASEQLADLETLTTPDIHCKLMQILARQKLRQSVHHGPATPESPVQVECEVLGTTEQVRQAAVPILLHTNAVLLRNKRYLAKVFAVGDELLIRAYHPSLPPASTEVHVTENEWTKLTGLESLKELNEEQKTKLCRRLLTLLRLSNPPNEMVYLNDNNKKRRLSRSRRDQIIDLARSTKLVRSSGSESRMSEYTRGLVISGQHILIRLALRHDFSCHIEGLIMQKSVTVRMTLSPAELTAICDVRRCELKEIFEMVTAELVLKERNKRHSLDLKSRPLESPDVPHVPMTYEQGETLVEAGNTQDAPVDVSQSPASVLPAVAPERELATRNSLRNFETRIDGWDCLCTLFDAGSECIVEARCLTKIDQKLSIRISRSKLPTIGDNVEGTALAQFISSHLEIRSHGGSEQLAWKESIDVLSDNETTMWTRCEPAPAVSPMLFEAAPVIWQFRQDTSEALEVNLESALVPQWHKAMDSAVAVGCGPASIGDATADPTPLRARAPPVKAQLIEDLSSKDERTDKTVFEGVAAPLAWTARELGDAAAMADKGEERKDSLETLEDIAAQGSLSAAGAVLDMETESDVCRPVPHIDISTRQRRESELTAIPDEAMKSEGASISKYDQCMEAATIENVVKVSVTALNRTKSTSAIVEEVEKVNCHVDQTKRTFTLSTCDDTDHLAQEHHQLDSEKTSGSSVEKSVDLSHFANEMVTRVLGAVLRRVGYDTSVDGNQYVPMFLVDGEVRVVDKLHAITSDDVQEMALSETEKAQLGLAFKSEQTPNEIRRISEALLASLFRLQSHIRVIKTGTKFDTSIAALAEVQEPDRETLRLSTATPLLKWKLEPERVVIEAFLEPGSKSVFELEPATWAHTGFQNVETISNDAKLDFIVALLASPDLSPSLTFDLVPFVLRTGQSHVPEDRIQMGFRLTSNDKISPHTYLLVRIVRIDSTVMRVFVLDTNKGMAWTHTVDLASMSPR